MLDVARAETLDEAYEAQVNAFFHNLKVCGQTKGVWTSTINKKQRELIEAKGGKISRFINSFPPATQNKQYLIYIEPNE